MFQRIAAATVIRGEGECQAFVDGIVNEEIKRQQARMRAERKADALYIDMLQGKCACHQDCRAAELGAMLNVRNPFKRMLGRIADAWALVAGTVIVWGEALGLLVYEGDKE